MRRRFEPAEPVPLTDREGNLLGHLVGVTLDLPSDGTAVGNIGVRASRRKQATAEQPELLADDHGPLRGSRAARERAYAEGKPLQLTFKGRRVPEPRARVACSLVRHFAERSGLAVQAWTPDGAVGESLRRVLGAVTAHPDVTFERWCAVVDGVLANPWWDGAPSIGVVFGPRVVEENLLRPERGGARRETAAERQRRERTERVRRRTERSEA